MAEDDDQRPAAPVSSRRPLPAPAAPRGTTGRADPPPADPGDGPPDDGRADGGGGERGPARDDAPRRSDPGSDDDPRRPEDEPRGGDRSPDRDRGGARPLTSGRGRVRLWPLPDGGYDFTQAFGCVGQLGGWYSAVSGCPFDAPAWHTGIDLAAPEGTRFYAAASGWVVEAGLDRDVGLANSRILVQHDGANTGYATEYLHWITTYVERGDYVRAGQPLGEVGSVGYSTGPHLHFGVVEFDSSERIDPVGWLPRSGGGGSYARLPRGTRPVTVDDRNRDVPDYADPAPRPVPVPRSVPDTPPPPDPAVGDRAASDRAASGDGGREPNDDRGRGEGGGDDPDSGRERGPAPSPPAVAQPTPDERDDVSAERSRRERSEDGAATSGDRRARDTAEDAVVAADGDEGPPPPVAADEGARPQRAGNGRDETAPGPRAEEPRTDDRRGDNSRRRDEAADPEPKAEPEPEPGSEPAPAPTPADPPWLAPPPTGIEVPVLNGGAPVEPAPEAGATSEPERDADAGGGRDGDRRRDGGQAERGPDGGGAGDDDEERQPKREAKG